LGASRLAQRDRPRVDARAHEARRDGHARQGRRAVRRRARQRRAAGRPAPERARPDRDGRARHARPRPPAGLPGPALGVRGLADGTGRPEAWTTLTALAASTRRLMLGPLVLNVANRHPGVLASMAATFQAVSGGRLLLGLGAGGSRRTPYAVEQDAIGQKVEGDEARARRVVEAITLMRRLWAGEAGLLRPTPPPPIIVGGFGPRMAAIAGRHGDGFNTQAMHPQLADLVRRARDEHAASGRDAARFL